MGLHTVSRAIRGTRGTRIYDAARVALEPWVTDGINVEGRRLCCVAEFDDMAMEGRLCFPTGAGEVRLALVVRAGTIELKLDVPAKIERWKPTVVDDLKARADSLLDQVLASLQ